MLASPTPILLAFPPSTQHFLYSPIHNHQHKTLKMVSWHRPQHGWVKINTDGAWKPSLGIATAGGVIRDSAGQWRLGFAMNLADCSSAILAELCGIMTGLRVAWEKGYRFVILESDCKIAVDAINSRRRKNCGGDEKRAILLSSIDEMLGREWCVRVQHQYREGNRVADGLANFGVSLTPGNIIESDHPLNQNILDLVIDDLQGLALPRLCPA